MNQLSESLRKCKVEGNVLFLPPITEGPLTNYNEVRSALLKAGAKYKKNTFIFESEAQPIIERLIGGEKVNPKKEFQFFATPSELANRLVELADLCESDLVLEPSAGKGAIVNAILERQIGKRVWGFELKPENQKELNQIPNFRLLGYDFLTECGNTFDKIIANPPFAKNQDIDHIRTMYSHLSDEGRIVSIASNHWRSSTNKKEVAFREWLEELNAEIIDLDGGTFKESGTMVSACIVIINKF